MFMYKILHEQKFLFLIGEYQRVSTPGFITSIILSL